MTSESEAPLLNRYPYISKRQKTNVLKVFSYIEANPIIDIQKTAAAVGLSYNTVSKIVLEGGI